MIANAQGNALNMTGANYQHQPENNEKELFYSCYIPGMKGYFKGKTK